MNHNYYEHYQLWCYVNNLQENEATWLKFIQEELTDGEGM